MITILSDGGLSEFIPQTAAARRENIQRIFRITFPVSTV
jgi:hypothetical protein